MYSDCRVDLPTLSVRVHANKTMMILLFILLWTWGYFHVKTLHWSLESPHLLQLDQLECCFIVTWLLQQPIGAEWILNYPPHSSHLTLFYDIDYWSYNLLNGFITHFDFWASLLIINDRLPQWIYCHLDILKLFPDLIIDYLSIRICYNVKSDSLNWLACSLESNI